MFTAYRSTFVSTKIPGFFAGTPSDLVTGQPVASARQNYFGRLQYNHNNRNLAEFQGRYDGSQNSAPQRWFWFFPVFLVGWCICEESRFKSVSAFRSINTYRLLGNDRFPQY